MRNSVISTFYFDTPKFSILVRYKPRKLLLGKPYIVFDDYVADSGFKTASGQPYIIFDDYVAGSSLNSLKIYESWRVNTLFH